MKSYQYDITVKVNLTMEYDEPQERLADVKDDAHAILWDFDKYVGGLHAWASDVSGGKATGI